MTRLNTRTGDRHAGTGSAWRACISLPVVVLLLASLGAQAARAPHSPHRIVALAMSVTIDTVGPPDGTSPERHVGEIDHLRLVFDERAIDPVTKRVPLLNLQHLTPAGFDPPRPDPVRMPMTDAWLDLSAQPYRVHYSAAVTHGTPILIEFDDRTRRLSIRSPGAASGVRLAGPYVIDPAPITDKTVSEAAVPQ
jgi:hypothetical protein